jgi:pimeloyl-ACP methyl ester carboxylesterase
MVLAFVAVSLVATIYIAARPGLRSLVSFYSWKIVAGRSHGGGYVQSNNASIYYETYGSGPPVLVLHGGLGSLEDMGYQIKALAKSHFVIAADSRGQGRSSDSDNPPLSYALMADDMCKLLGKLRVPRADVVGWSDGGIVGLDLAMRHPGLVKKLVAISANFDASGVSLDKNFGSTIPSVPLRYRLQAADYNHWPVIYRKVVVLWRTQPHYSLAQLGQIKAPTLIMAGEFDLVKSQHTDQLAQAIPRGRKIIVQGATHFVPIDKPEIVNREILRFLGGDSLERIDR